MNSVNIHSSTHVTYYLKLGHEDYYFQGYGKLGKWREECGASVSLHGNVQKEQLRAAFMGGIQHDFHEET